MSQLTQNDPGGVGELDAFSAGSQSVASGTIVFSNSNGITFGMSGSSRVTASHAVNLSAGSVSNNLTAAVFSNSNGVTFGLTGSTITGSHDGLTSQSNQAASASNGSFAFQTIAFSNANDVTFGTSAGSIITASVNSGLTSQSNQAASASNGSFAFQTLNFSNANDVTFGTSAGGIITASVNSGLTSQSNQAASASNGSFAFQTLNFSNANDVTFGTSAGGVVTASVNSGLTSQSNQAASASNGSFAFQTLNFSNANNVTFGTSAGSVVTASVAAGGGTRISFFEIAAIPNSAVSPSDASVYFQRFNVAQSIDITVAAPVINISGADTGPASTKTQGYTMFLGVYTMGGSTASIASSTSATSTFSGDGAVTNSTVYQGISGTRYRSFAVGTWALVPGDYLLGFILDTNAGGAGTLASYSIYAESQASLNGLVGGSGNDSKFFRHGAYSVTSGSLPGSVQLSDIYYTGNRVRDRFNFQFAGTF